jgi:hypothetical protein
VILSTFTAIASPALPADRALTVEPLLARATAVRARLAAARDTHLDLAQTLTTIDVKKLQPRIKAEFWPKVGTMLSNGRVLRDLLDAARDGLRDAARAITSTRTENEFVAAVRVVEQSVKDAEGSAAAIDDLATKILATLDTLDESCLSEAYVVPPAPTKSMTPLVSR